MGIKMKRLLLMMILISNQAVANQDKQAIEHTVKALYIQTGINLYVEELDRKYTPTFIKEYGGWFMLADSIGKREVKISWTFP